jgi:hypothetical protein
MNRTIRSLRAHFVVLAIVFCAPISSAFAEGEGRIIGTVLDASGARVAGARIVLTREGSEFKQERVSGDNGTFTLLVLDASARYHIHIEKEHFLPLDEPLVPVAGDTLRITLTLKPQP